MINSRYSAVAESDFSNASSAPAISHLSGIYDRLDRSPGAANNTRNDVVNSEYYGVSTASNAPNSLYSYTGDTQISHYDSMAGPALYADLPSNSELHNESTYAYSDIQGAASGLLQDPKGVTARVGTGYVDVDE